MPDAVLNALNRKLAAYEGAGRDDLAKAVRKAITEREKEAEKASAPLSELTKAELLDRAAAADIEGRSSMTKDELVEALED